MIGRRDVVRVSISADDMRLIRSMMEGAIIYRSNIRKDEIDRKQQMHDDALIGQIGTLAGHRWMYGHIEGYRVSRFYQSLNRWTTDGGSDIAGANVDFKASRRRAEWPLSRYKLLVRPKERRADWVYIHALIDYPFAPDDTTTAYLTGWARDDMLSPAPIATGPLAGAFYLPVPSLNPLPPLSWAWAMPVAHIAPDKAA